MSGCRKLSLVLAAVAVFALSVSIRAQVLDSPYVYSNPALQQDAFVRNMNAIAVEGLMQRHIIEQSVGGSGNKRNQSSTRTTNRASTLFRGSKEFVIADLLVKQSGATAQQKAEALKIIEQMVIIYADTATKDGFPANDLAYAFQYYVVQNYHVYHNVFENPVVIPYTNTIDVSKTPNYISSFGEKALFNQFKIVLTQNPAVTKLSDLQKQQYTELLAVVTNINFTAYSEGLKRKDRKIIEQARAAAKQNLERLFGVSADEIAITDAGLSLKK
ncbi:MAG: hypothetical protein M3384_09650 [Acidobacteriota bacterium]|nr:hypothetical protein [Acidobacteriota bacterium]